MAESLIVCWVYNFNLHLYNYILPLKVKDLRELFASSRLFADREANQPQSSAEIPSKEGSSSFVSSTIKRNQPETCEEGPSSSEPLRKRRSDGPSEVKYKSQLRLYVLTYPRILNN